MAFPHLSTTLAWTTTRSGLHQAAQVIGAIRAATIEPEPNWTHLGLRVVPHGLTTGLLPELGSFELDFRRMAIVYRGSDGEQEIFSLAQTNQHELAETMLSALAARGHRVAMQRANSLATASLELDPVVAQTYAKVLADVDDVMQRFRASLSGEKSPVIVWPHGFDLAFMWFATEIALEAEPHIAFGFSPYSDGFERPYIYAYTHPVPERLTEQSLPPLVRWTTGTWTGVVIDYDALSALTNPALVLESTLRQLHSILARNLL